MSKAIFESDCPRVENGLDFENNNVSDLVIDDSDNVYDFDSTQDPIFEQLTTTQSSHFYRLRIKIHLRSVEDKIEGKGRSFM